MTWFRNCYSVLCTHALSLGTPQNDLQVLVRVEWQLLLMRYCAKWIARRPYKRVASPVLETSFSILAYSSILQTNFLPRKCGSFSIINHSQQVRNVYVDTPCCLNLWPISNEQLLDEGMHVQTNNVESLIRPELMNNVTVNEVYIYLQRDYRS